MSERRPWEEWVEATVQDTGEISCCRHGWTQWVTMSPAERQKFLSLSFAGLKDTQSYLASLKPADLSKEAESLVGLKQATWTLVGAGWVSEAEFSRRRDRAGATARLRRGWPANLLNVGLCLGCLADEAPRLAGRPEQATGTLRKASDAIAAFIPDLEMWCQHYQVAC